MRIIQKILLLFLITILGCNKSEQLVLSGRLGDKFESSFRLNKTGEKVSGHFIYKNDESKKIVVTGTIKGNNIRIEEYSTNKNTLTGFFYGKFDGITFQGYWEDPKKNKRIPFLYTIDTKKIEKEENQYRQNESLLANKEKIEYLTFENFGGDFYYRLEARIGKKQYRITDVNDGNGMFVKIVDVRDFDKDGYEDALVEETLGGNAVPFSSLFFCSYDKKKDRFITSESFGSISSSPKIEKWKEKWSIRITSHGEMYRADERYVYQNGELMRVEYNEAKPLKAIKDMFPEDFNEYEKQNTKALKYDLDGDGIDDLIIGQYWDRWNSISWEVKFANGKHFEGPSGCERIGILPSRTKGVHDLVCGIDYVFVWNGKKYKEK